MLDGMTYGDQLTRHLRRVGISPHVVDAAANLQISILRDLINIAHSALDDEEIPPEVTRRVLDRIIYGGSPLLADIEIRGQMIKTVTEMADRSVRRWPTGQ